MPAVRVHAAACVMGSAIHIFGGRDGDGQATSTTYHYSTDTNTWATLASMPEAKGNHRVCVLDESVNAMGCRRIGDQPSASVPRVLSFADGTTA
jgi:N-acetylneuraminic acid mutarotase